jgi:hypothetical protein
MPFVPVPGSPTRRLPSCDSSPVGTFRRPVYGSITWCRAATWGPGRIHPGSRGDSGAPAERSTTGLAIRGRRAPPKRNGNRTGGIGNGGRAAARSSTDRSPTLPSAARVRRGRRRHAPQEPHDLPLHLSEAASDHRRGGHEHDGESPARQLPLVPPIGLTNQSLQAIANHRSPETLPDGHPDTIRALRAPGIPDPIDMEDSSPDTPSAPENARELLPASNPLFLGVSRRSSRDRPRVRTRAGSGRAQTLAPAFPAELQDPPTGFRLHPLPKAVRPLAAYAARFVGEAHPSSPRCDSSPPPRVRSDPVCLESWRSSRRFPPESARQFPRLSGALSRDPDSPLISDRAVVPSRVLVPDRAIPGRVALSPERGLFHLKGGVLGPRFLPLLGVC